MHIESVHTGLSILIRSLYLRFSSSFSVDVVFYWVRCDFLFFGVYSRNVVCAYMCFYFSTVSIVNMLGAFLNVFTWLNLLVIDLVLYLCVTFLFTLMSLFCGLSTYGITWGCSSGLSAFYFSSSNFWQLSYFWCNC